MREILVWKLRGLMVYEKGGLSVFKIFLFISQLFCCFFIKFRNSNCLGFVPFLIRCRDRQIIVATKFCNYLETGPVKCRDIEINVATFFLVHFLNLCRDNENMCRDINLPFKIESKINYIATQKNNVATFY